jgi:uncharacterized membrane protein YfcA
MLTPLSIGIITLTVLATSFISGIFGMAGGVILLGVLLLFLDVAPAMVLFGVIQFVSNGWPATLWWRYARWSLIWRYLIGSTTMFLLLRLISFIPDKATVYLALGLIPFAIDLRKLLGVAGWAKHAVIYEFTSNEDRAKNMENTGTHKVQWGEDVIAQTVHSPGSPVIGFRKWPKV